MKIKDFYELVELNREPEASLLPNLQYRIKKYPYFQPDIFIYIKCLYLSNSENFADELTKLAPFVSDRKALFYYVMNDQYKQFQQKAEKRLSADRTNLLINAFFETLNDPESDSIHDIFESPNLASVDYFSYLESIDGEKPDAEGGIPSIDSYIPTKDIDLLETESDIQFETPSDIPTNTIETDDTSDDLEEDDIPMLKHQDIIDRFITKAASEESLRIKLDPSEETLSEEELDNPEPESSQQELENDFFFTQTLANIYIKQKKYKRAYEIIKHLSLNYPEKNIYFADQLSFLEKLIKNTNINK
ncbi:hypothetical protein LJC00_01470 [Dysgonomonas sp. OttesenSCG-928-M03]|nr:hypothetical protein [Dysgonomonas sp. OttesenSCG-928-M03]